MSSPTIRAALAFAALSAWLVLLMSGFALGGAIHLLLAGALALFPWRAARGEEAGEGEEAGGGDSAVGSAASRRNSSTST